MMCCTSWLIGGMGTQAIDAKVDTLVSPRELRTANDRSRILAKVYMTIKLKGFNCAIILVLPRFEIFEDAGERVEIGCESQRSKRESFPVRDSCNIILLTR